MAMRKSLDEIVESEDIESSSDAHIQRQKSRTTSEIITEVSSEKSVATIEPLKATEIEPAVVKKIEFMKTPVFNHIWTLVLEFLKLKAVTRFQGVATKFYNLLVPKILERTTNNSLPKMSRSKYLF